MREKHDARDRTNFDRNLALPAYLHNLGMFHEGEATASSASWTDYTQNASDIPVPDTFRAEQDSVVQVHIGIRAVAKRLARMEDEWDVQTELLLPFHELLERYHVVREGIQRVFMPH